MQYCSYHICNETTTTKLTIIITITEKAASTKGLVAYIIVYPRPLQTTYLIQLVIQGA
jgi:hypothetical protein